MLGALGVCGAAVAGGSVAPTRAWPDRFEHHGIPVWWCGWREPPSQDVVIGWWVASVPPDEYGLSFLVSTVGGVVHRNCEGGVVDTTHYREWPRMTWRTTLEEKEARKQRAAAHLVECLDA